MLKVYFRDTNCEVAVTVDDIMRLEHKTQEQAINAHAQRVYQLLCGNYCYGNWMDLSQEYMNVINKYRGKAKLEKYVPTEYDLKMCAENPDHWNDMPRWYVKGLDRALSSDILDRKMRAEFVRRFDEEDEAIIKMVNTCNPAYKIVRVA